MTHRGVILGLFVASFLAILQVNPLLAEDNSPHILVSLTQAGAYRTVQEAINHAPMTGATIFIDPGVYKEKILITKPAIRLIGTGDGPSSVVLTFGDSAKSTGSTFRSGTVTVLTDAFEAENLSIVDTWWDEHPSPSDYSQAVALYLVADRAVLDRVRIISGQDTLFAGSSTCRTNEDKPCHASRQMFNDSYIEGNVDYIFGDARAVFKDCELHSRASPNIAITAQSKNSPNSDSGYYFLHCSITGRNAGDSVVFGRPWRTYSTVMFYDTNILQKLAPEGWSEWENRLCTSTYREYRSHGPGVNPDHRAVVYPPLSAAEEATLNTAGLFGRGDWNPEAEITILRHLAAESRFSSSVLSNQHTKELLR